MSELESFSNDVKNPIPEMIANRIRVEEMIGRGGMGTVYRATHLGLDRIVAVKIINPEFVANEDVTQRFSREARLMAKLRHPRAAMIYDSGNLPDGRLFIVMEYVEGITLADYLKSKGKIPYQRAVEIAVCICDVLGEAHSLGIIHRDLKPANIMLNGQDVYVLDFGIAKMLDSNNSESMKLSMTGKGAIVGTPYYMSPEQCLGEPVEARSDLYSLGALLYEMIAGRPPFNDEVLSAIIIKHAMVEPPRLEESNAEIPLALADVVNKLLAKKPSERPENAAETRTLLERSIKEKNIQNLQNEVTQAFSTPADSAHQIKDSKTSATPSVQTASNAGISNAKVFGLTFGIGALVLLLAGGLIAGFIWMKSRPGATIAANTNSSENNSFTANTYSMGNMDHSQHQMPSGDDFAKNLSSSNDEKTSAPATILTNEQADAVITKIAQTTIHRADGMQIIKTPKDTALVCLHNMIAEGKSHIFVVERANPNSDWEISARISLDTPEFRSANWKFEPQDVDRDGFEEVIFTGANADNTAQKTLIYAPRTRQNYSILSVNDADGKNISKKLSPNAETANSAAFRNALEQSVQVKVNN
jgi:serine/threonine protein kinase